MSTTVAQLIEHLKTLPQDAIVEVGKEVTKSYSTYMDFSPVDFDATVVFDVRDDKFVHLQAE